MWPLSQGRPVIFPASRGARYAISSMPIRSGVAKVRDFYVGIGNAGQQLDPARMTSAAIVQHVTEQTFEAGDRGVEVADGKTHMVCARHQNAM
jgi:hypothetical protein